MSYKEVNSEKSLVRIETVPTKNLLKIQKPQITEYNKKENLQYSANKKQIKYSMKTMKLTKNANYKY